MVYIDVERRALGGREEDLAEFPAILESDHLDLLSMGKYLESAPAQFLYS